MNKEGLLRFGKFMVSSGLSFLVDMGLFTLLNWLLPVLGYQGSEDALIMISTVCARVVSAIFNYLVNSNAVFKSGGKGSTVRYFILAICQMLLSGRLVALALKGVYLLIPAFSTVNIVKSIVKGIVDSVLFLISYKIQKEWVFKK